MDGHILITCGIVLMLCFRGVQQNETMPLWIALAASLSLLLYCGLIFPFLKSFGMMAVSLVTTVAVLIRIINP
jgi:hypothetical protein